ncbi:MAG: HAMP domain-containing sensor histidine kinase [Anaerolineae bacterium]
MTPLEAALLSVLEAEGVAVLVRAADGAVLYASPAARAARWDEPGVEAIGASSISLADGGMLVVGAAQTGFSSLREARESMMYTLSHDLLTPIGVVDGFAELLHVSLPDDMDPELRMFADRIRTSSGRLTLLARQIGRYGWLAAGLPVDEARVDLGTLLDEVVFAVAARARERSVTLEMRAGDNVPAALGDEAMLRSALEQVVVNALIYSDPGQAVTVGVAQNGDCVELTVADRGIGIPSGELETIWHRNTRGANPRVQAVEGAGYGLALARLVIERAGGRIGIESTLGEGTIVTVMLRAAL